MRGWRNGKKTGEYKLVDLEKLIEDELIDLSDVFAEALDDGDGGEQLETIGSYIDKYDDGGGDFLVTLILYKLTAYGITIFYWGESTDFDDCYGTIGDYMFNRDESVAEGHEWIEQKKAEYETTKSE